MMRGAPLKIHVGMSTDDETMADQTFKNFHTII